MWLMQSLFERSPVRCLNTPLSRIAAKWRGVSWTKTLVIIRIKLIPKWWWRPLGVPFQKMGAISDSPRDNGICSTFQMSGSKVSSFTRTSPLGLKKLRKVHRSRPIFPASTVGCTTLLPIPLENQQTSKEFAVVDVGVTTLARNQLSSSLKHSAQRSNLRWKPKIIPPFLSRSFISQRPPPTGVASKQSFTITWRSCYFSLSSYLHPSVSTILLINVGGAVISCSAHCCFESWCFCSIGTGDSWQIQRLWWTTDQGPSAEIYFKCIARLIWT